ncbi:MAG TPA: aspartate carbamoyltransferase [Clostridiales bacterium]|nr:MAG: Aspartate carbamoyltransferase catalytic chain [Firmicutes bacterium ADurb.Bin262]HOU10352.1 aspartate carbamoyltransferase [Clostridiales bacterium]HQH62357.1 aspartate carbamoyltransferase [Clostridiales bacterium]HQK73849.1 aspartate carbamoyltransferase [Clostridiales bacterium]
MEIRDLIDLGQLTQADTMQLLDMAQTVKNNPSYFIDHCHGNIMATLFYEPSTRTQMSFQAAMLRLGGKIIGFDNPGNSSVSKGESLKDTVKVVSNYCDIIVIRNPLEGAALAASLFSRCPVINAGDGGHLHPTQTLTDLVTLFFEKKRLEGLTVGLCGDNKNGRTVHSLAKSLSKYPGNRFVFISTPQLQAPAYILDAIKANGCEYETSQTLEGVIGDLDVLYMTRIQRERFSDAAEYTRQKGVFILDAAKMRHAKKDLTVMHPLPRVDEIAVDVDDDPRAAYFKQTEYGLYARMALIMNMLANKNAARPAVVQSTEPFVCTNDRCITKTETYLPKYFTPAPGGFLCGYCEHKAQ